MLKSQIKHIKSTPIDDRLQSNYLAIIDLDIKNEISNNLVEEIFKVTLKIKIYQSRKIEYFI